MTIGLDIGYDAVRLAALEQTATEGHIVNCVGVQPLTRSYLPHELLRAGEDVTNAIRTVMETYGNPDWPVVLGVRNRFATVARLAVDKSMDAKTSYRWMHWEIEQTVPDPVEQYAVDIAMTGHETETSREAFVIAARHESINTFLRYCEEAGVYPLEVTVASVALINAFEAAHPLSEWESAALVHLEPGALDFILVRSTAFHIVTLPLDTADGSAGFDQAGGCIERVLNEGMVEETPDRIFVSAVHPELAGLCERWSKQTGRPITPVAPFENLERNPALEDQLRTMDQAGLMVAVGLALQVNAEEIASSPAW